MVECLAQLVCYSFVPLLERGDAALFLRESFPTIEQQFDFSYFLLGLEEYPGLPTLFLSSSRSILIAIGWVIGKLDILSEDDSKPVLPPSGAASPKSTYDCRKFESGVLPFSANIFKLEDSYFKDLTDSLRVDTDSPFLAQSHFIHQMLGKISSEIRELDRQNTAYVRYSSDILDIQERARQQYARQKATSNSNDLSGVESDPQHPTAAPTSLADSHTPVWRAVVGVDAEPLTLTPHDLSVLRSPSSALTAITRDGSPLADSAGAILSALEAAQAARDAAAERQQLVSVFWLWMESVIHEETRALPTHSLVSDREWTQLANAAHESVTSGESSTATPNTNKLPSHSDLEVVGDSLRATLNSFISLFPPNYTTASHQPPPSHNSSSSPSPSYPQPSLHPPTSVDASALVPLLQRELQTVEELQAQDKRQFSLASLAEADSGFGRKGRAKREWQGGGDELDLLSLPTALQQSLVEQDSTISAFSFRVLAGIFTPAVINRTVPNDSSATPSSTALVKHPLTSPTKSSPSAQQQQQKQNTQILLDPSLLPLIERSLAHHAATATTAARTVETEQKKKVGDWLDASVHLSDSPSLHDNDKTGTSADPQPIPVQWRSVGGAENSLRARAESLLIRMESEREARKREEKERREEYLREREARRKKHQEEEEEKERRRRGITTERQNRKAEAVHKMVVKWFGQDNT